MRKYKCMECGWRGYEKDLATAPHPFDKDDIISACPECFEICELEAACDLKGCYGSVACGKPINGEYKRLCSVHCSAMGDE